jgi:hypothetical protein
VAGTDQEAAILLPIAIGELCSALERLTSPSDRRAQVDAWLDAHREGRLGDAA